ncbi:hypothetical protein [Methylobacterium sp. 77]|uniref:hypothetical protein n=1 Tax=Methylobacterium sp. 77 TaxID=1101192 RepID=UPI00037AD449|nr:hypothetical protein [Methylobacterium sp. 77]
MTGAAQAGDRSGFLDAPLIFGGIGGGKLYAGAGSDTFAFKANFGRDTVYGFESGLDHFNVSAFVGRFDQVSISELHGGADTLITRAGISGTNKIILHDVAASSIQETDFIGFP